MVITDSAAPEQECIDCGSTTGPDRRARWECGETDLDTWDRCEYCRNLLCDSCSLDGNHICYRMAGEHAVYG